MPRPAGAGSSLPVRAARDRRVRPTPRARLSARASAKARARRSGDAGRGAGAAVQCRRAIRAAAAMARRLTVHSAARQGNCMQPARGYGVVVMWSDAPQRSNILSQLHCAQISINHRLRASNIRHQNLVCYILAQKCIIGVTREFFCGIFRFTPPQIKTAPV